jgi:autotransporter-associated beta strand protein
MLSRSLALGSSSGVNLTGNGAVLDLSDANNQTIQDLTGIAGSTIKLQGRLTFGTANSTSFAGVIEQGYGTGSLAKQGTGALTITGLNIFTGATTVNAGTLTVGTGGGLASSTVSVASGATFNLNGGTLSNLSNLNLSQSGYVSLIQEPCSVGNGHQLASTVIHFDLWSA